MNAFILGTVGFVALTVLIYGASRLFLPWIKKHRSLSNHFTQILLIFFLCVYNFVLSAQRIIDWMPAHAFETTLCGLLNIALYFTGMAAYYAGSYTPKYFDVKDFSLARRNEVSDFLRMWLPFILPFFLLTLLDDALAFMPDTYLLTSFLSLSNAADRSILSLILTALLFLLLIIFSPYLIQRLWLCKPIDDVDLWLRLAKVSQKAKFRCADFSIWTIMRQFHTAAILGMIPRFRYVMFTERLIDELPVESIEAILVHEIGHSYRKHLLILPFIIFGMFALAALFTLFFYDGIQGYIALKKAASPSVLWDIAVPMAFILPYLVIFGLYFRFVFGFYSRLFERQADLHAAVVGIPLKNMIHALDHIAIVTGNTHNHPSWHHYSVKERIEYLESVIENPSKANTHHQRVRLWVCAYFVVFITFSTLLLAASFPEAPLLKNIAQPIEHANQAITRWMTH